jgi:hypothetical protein
MDLTREMISITDFASDCCRLLELQGDPDLMHQGEVATKLLPSLCCGRLENVQHLSQQVADNEKADDGGRTRLYVAAQSCDMQ